MIGGARRWQFSSSRCAGKGIEAINLQDEVKRRSRQAPSTPNIVDGEYQLTIRMELWKPRLG